MLILKILVLIFMIFTPNVYASTYTLELKEDYGTVYYDMNNNNTNVFMNHKNMLPGEIYTGEIIIKSTCSKELSLYFDFKMKKQNDLEEELLNNINMKVYINEVLQYDGVAKASLYIDNEDIKEEDLIYLGTYNKSSQSRIRVETSLKDEYEVKDTDIAKTELNFYIKSGNDVVSIPNTSKNFNLNYYIVILIALLFLVPYYLKKKLSIK